MSAQLSASVAPTARPLSPRQAAKFGRPHPGFIATTFRIIWVLALTGAALVGGIIYQARTSCPEPCWINGLTPVEAMRGAPKPMPPR